MAANNFDAFLLAMGGANAALKLLEMAAGAAAAAQLLGVRRGGGGAGAGAGAGTSGQKPKPGAAGGGGMKGAAKGIMKRAGPLGLLYGLYEGYQSMNQIDQDLEAGNITSNEASVDKAEVTGGVVGGTGGAMAGAAAGAALGSVVPVVGTLIGGVIGGAVGYWAGSSAGEAIGEQIGEALVGPEDIAAIEAKIKAEEERIKRSEAGVNEYWGRESKGREESQKQIEQYKKDLELINKRNAEIKAEEAKAEEKKNEVPGNPEEKTTDTNDAQKTLEQKAEEEKKKAEAEKKKAEEEQRKKDAEGTTNPDGTPMSSNTTQKTPDQLLGELNTSMNQLVQLATTQTMLAKKQLGVSGEAVGDLYSSV